MMRGNVAAIEQEVRFLSVDSVEHVSIQIFGTDILRVPRSRQGSYAGRECGKLGKLSAIEGKTFNLRITDGQIQGTGLCLQNGARRGYYHLGICRADVQIQVHFCRLADCEFDSASNLCLESLRARAH